MRDNHVAVGCRVEGCHGPFGTNPNEKRRVRTKASGTVIRAAERHTLVVVLDYDGGEKKLHQVHSRLLTIASVSQ